VQAFRMIDNIQAQIELRRAVVNRGRECIVNRPDADGARSILPLPASPGKMDSDPARVPAGVH
jgi:hypothetical protein